MHVRVRLLLTFKDKAPDGERPFALTLAGGCTVDRALESLSISDDAAKVVLVNGRLATGTQRLSDGDELTVFPPLEGG